MTCVLGQNAALRMQWSATFRATCGMESKEDKEEYYRRRNIHYSSYISSAESSRLNCKVPHDEDEIEPEDHNKETVIYPWMRRIHNNHSRFM